jgi:Sulfotransferase domain
MVSPIVICDGMIRSGSTWSFNVCRLMGDLLAKRRGQAHGSAYLDRTTLDQFLVTQAYVREGPAIVKGHELGPVALDWIRTGRAKAVCTIRDPRDCIASDIVFWGAGFDASISRVVSSIKYLADYQDFGRTLFIRYEEMMEDRMWQIKRIAAYLKITLDQKDAEAIDAQTNIRASRKVCEGLSGRTDKDVDMILDSHRRDRTTLLHDNHIGTGEVGRWKRELTPEQGEKLTHLLQRSLRALGYESDGSTLASSRPASAAAV